MSCALIPHREAGDAPGRDNIARTRLWDFAHEYDIAVPNRLLTASRRHNTALADMTAEQAAGPGRLLRDASPALAKMTAWSTAYSARSAESQRQPHAHFHLRPRKPDLEPEQAGRGAFDLMAVHGKRVAYSDMDDLAERLRPLLAAYSEGA